MAYVKNTWVDREGQTRYHETIDDDGALIFTPDYEKVTEMGTPVNADNMNHIEEGIVDHESRITVLENLPDKYLNKSQITNCILEIPQRIKYTLEDGTLTIHAGSVVIVPYGTEDLTSQYPKGATFLNDNFKVYDTQFEDGKFFVWAELVDDVGTKGDTWSTLTNRIICLNVNADYISGYNTGESSTGSTASKTYTMFYSTDLNRMGVAANTTTVDFGAETPSLPILLADTVNGTGFSSVNQVFNGMGYIGSIVWVDKGVKGLIPNGRNEDGTLKNAEIATTTLRTTTITADDAYNIYLSNGNFYVSKLTAYDEEKNINYGTVNKDFRFVANCGAVTMIEGAISGFRTKLPVNLATKDMVDGQWVNCQYIIAKDVACPTVNTTYDVSSILPNDGYIYELLCDVVVKSGTTSGNISSIGVSSDILGSNAFNVCAVKATSTTQVMATGWFSIPIGGARQLMFAGFGSNKGTFTLCARIYRRLGTNI